MASVDDCSEPEGVLSEELAVLESIYITELTIEKDDEGRAKTVSVVLHPSTGMDDSKKFVCLTLCFLLPPQYPDSVPEIVVRNPRGLGEEELESLSKDMKSVAEDRKGGPMLFELIEMAKDCLTEGNIPHCECAICLERFEEGDNFVKTDCYHYYHRPCLARYVAAFVSRQQEEETEGQGPLHMSKSEDKALGCPMCRLPLTCDVAALLAEPVVEETEEKFVPSPELVQQQRERELLFKQQQARGGIIDLEHEKNKFLVDESTVVPLDNLRKKPDSDDTKAIPSSASSQNSQSVSIGEAKTHGNQRQHSGRSWRREEHVGNHSKGDRQSGRHWREKDEVQYRDSHHRNDHRRAPESRDYHRNARRKNEHRYQNSPRNDDRNLGNDHSDRRRGQADYHRSYRDNRRGHTKDNQDVAQDSNDHVDDRKNRQKDGRNNHRHIEDVGNNVRGGREVHADEEDRESHREKGDSGKNHSRDPHYHGRDSGRNRRGRRGPQHRGEGPPENREVVQKSYEDSRENDIIRTSQGNDESKQGEQGKDIPRNVSRQGGERRDYRDSKSHSGHEGNDDCARDGERTFPRDKHDDAGSLDGNRSLRQLEQHHRTEHRTDREHPRTDHRQDREFHRGGSRGRYRGNRHVGQRGGKRGESGNPGEIHRSRDGQHGYGEQMGREGEISHSSHSRHPHSAMGGGSSGETDREMERTSIRMDDNLVDNPDGGLSSSQHFNAHPKEAEGKGFHPRHRTDFRRGGRRGGWHGRERNNHDSEPGLDNAHPSHNGPGCDLNLPAEKDRHKSSSIRDGGSNSHDNDRWRKEGSGEASTQWHDNQFDNRRSKPSQKGEWRGKGNSSRWEPQDRVNVDKPSPAQIHMSDSNPERVSGHGAPPGFPSRSGPPPGFSQRHGKKGSPHGGRGDTEIPVVAPPPGFEFS